MRKRGDRETVTRSGAMQVQCICGRFVKCKGEGREPGRKSELMIAKGSSARFMGNLVRPAKVASRRDQIDGLILFSDATMRLRSEEEKEVSVHGNFGSEEF